MCLFIFEKISWPYYLDGRYVLHCRWWMQSPVTWFYLSSTEKHSRQNSLMKKMFWLNLDWSTKIRLNFQEKNPLRLIMTEKIYINSNFGYLWPLMTKSKKCFMGSFCKIWIQLALLHRAPLNIILRFVFFVFNTLI